MKFVAALIVWAVLALPVLAVEPDEILSDPALEARARVISANVRCVVCQNEPIDTSNAGIARDLRLLIRERLLAGDSNDQVYAFLVARYGDYVLFKPPFKPSTYALWFAPVAILFMGGIAVVLNLRGGRRQAEGLSDVERQELAEILDDDDKVGG